MSSSVHTRREGLARRTVIRSAVAAGVVLPLGGMAPRPCHRDRQALVALRGDVLVLLDHAS